MEKGENELQCYALRAALQSQWFQLHPNVGSARLPVCRLPSAVSAVLPGRPAAPALRLAFPASLPFCVAYFLKELKLTQRPYR